MLEKKIKRIHYLSVVVIMLTIFGCAKDTTVVIDNSPAITETVSFKKTILPIMVQNCSGSNCHSGSVSPNLSEALAYSTLTSGSYINTAAPAKSELYLWLTGKRSAAMPLGATNNPSKINALTLAWITQGAKNN
ncbi:MAG: alpha-L-arabinofuranosidase [Ferruginibacter sp.]|uniref:hypothetical protein n=1 Tax=Ferruginibacter sp. TaxID=1940288 RepID=UPI00265ACC66|nr:hypothetical protein [Ferruginibacter sp.]MDB5275949.1 alpha-L-arabinofuranosidase [Ferruginibacter sp.]